MRPIIFSLFLTVTITAAGSLAFASPAAKEEKKPNILLVVGDDVGFGDLGISGAVTSTPSLDRLARQGITFTNFHATPVCSVTRGMLLTGNNSIDIGLGAFDFSVAPSAAGKPGYEGYITDNAVTIAELLRDNGYNTYMVGKWHLGGAHGLGKGPSKWGFSRSYGIYTGGANHWNKEVFHFDKHDPDQVEMVKQKRIPHERYYEDGNQVERPVGIFSDTLFTNKLLEYMEEGRKTGKPFFSYLAYTTPHAPLQAPDFLIDKYYDHYLETGFEGLRKKRFEVQKMLGVIPKDSVYVSQEDKEYMRQWNNLTEEQKKLEARTMAVYSAMMESQDFHIGLVMNYLYETGQLDNTLVIYMGDNGPEGMADRGLIKNTNATEIQYKMTSTKLEDVGRGNSFWGIGADWAMASTGSLQWWKWFIGEGGIRVPMLLVPPKDSTLTKRGSISNEFISVMDLPMTILEYAGVEYPVKTYKDRKLTAPAGISVKPYLEGKRKVTRSEEEWVAFELFGNVYVIAGDYKAIKVRTGMYGDGKWHLYNIKKDPVESTPLESEMPKRLEKMIAIYDSYAKEKGVIEVEESWNPWYGSYVPEQSK